jgi:hypothetical protein
MARSAIRYWAGVSLSLPCWRTDIESTPRSDSVGARATSVAATSSTRVTPAQRPASDQRSGGRLSADGVTVMQHGRFV